MVLSQGKRIGPKEHVSGGLHYVPERIRKTGYVFLGPDTFPLAEDQPDIIIIIIIIIIISIILVLLVLISLLLFILLLLLL